MRKIILAFAFILIFCISAYSAAAPTLLEMRNELFKSSQEIKSGLKDTKDAVLLNSMWDSCIIAVSQLDAYFHIIGIFNTIKKEEVTSDAFKYLTSWLSQMLQTNELNVRILESVQSTKAPKTKVYILKLKNNFNELNNRLRNEILRVSQVQQASGQEAAK